jgi:hypothetical protein
MHSYVVGAAPPAGKLFARASVANSIDGAQLRGNLN